MLWYFVWAFGILWSNSLTFIGLAAIVAAVEVVSKLLLFALLHLVAARRRGSPLRQAIHAQSLHLRLSTGRSDRSAEVAASASVQPCRKNFDSCRQLYRFCVVLLS